MALYTRAEKTELIAAYTEALKQCALGQEYVIGTRRLRRADLPEIRSTLDWLENLATVEDELAGLAGPRFTQCIPGRGTIGGGY